MFLCSGAGAAQPPSEGVLRGNERKQGVWRGLSVLYMRFWPSRARVWFPALPTESKTLVPGAPSQERRAALNQSFTALYSRACRRLGSGPRAQKHAFSTSAPAELHVRAARREKGARRALGRFEPVGSLASLWGVRNRY